MAWSASGNVASFPTQLLNTTTNPAQFTMSLRFYADEAAGVVYIVGRWTMGTGTQAVRMNAVLLDPPFRPLGASIDCVNSGAAGATAPLSINADGSLTAGYLPPSPGWNASVRSFYFTTVIPG